MSQVNLAIVFYSKSGTNYKLAQMAKEGAEAAGANVRILKVEEIAPASVIEADEVWRATVESLKEVPVVSEEDIEWADAVIFSTPTRFGVMASQMKQFLDTTGGLWATGKTVNKVVSAMATAGNQNGGQEATILSLYTALMHWGAIIAAPGYTDESAYAAGGNPYGVSATVNQEGEIVEDVEAAVKHQAARTVQIAEWLIKGKE